jgi:hypothetical protein
MLVDGETSKYASMEGGGPTVAIVAAAPGVNWRVTRAVVAASHAAALFIKDSDGTVLETLRVPAGGTKDFPLHLDVTDAKGISVTGDGDLGWTINARIHRVRVFS